MLSTQPDPPPFNTLYKYIDLYVFTQGRGGRVGEGEPVRRLEGQYFTRGVEDVNMTGCISSL
jgi:hypothetical protein